MKSESKPGRESGFLLLVFHELLRAARRFACECGFAWRHMYIDRDRCRVGAVRGVLMMC
ncbi:hypothetical protein [Metallibacterium sp.]